jgi:hypothetical protein
MGENAARVIANCWRFIDNLRRLSPYSSASISLHVCPSFHITFSPSAFWFSEYEHLLPLVSHPHTQGRRVQYFNDPRTKSGAIYSVFCWAMNYYRRQTQLVFDAR